MVLTPITKTRGIERFPPIFPRIVDFGPLITAQVKIDPYLQINEMLGTVSWSLTPMKKIDPQQNKDGDITIKRNITNPTILDIEFCSPDILAPKSQKEVWDDVNAISSIEIPEMNIDRRTVIEKVPKKMESEYPQLSGLDALSIREEKVGNYYRSLKRRFGLRDVTNAFDIMKHELMENELWSRTYAHRLRGILKSETMMGIIGKSVVNREIVGWRGLFPPSKDVSHRSAFPFATNLNASLITNKWQDDVAYPIEFLGQGKEIEGAIYGLTRRQGTRIAI